MKSSVYNAERERERERKRERERGLALCVRSVFAAACAFVKKLSKHLVFSREESATCMRVPCVVKSRFAAATGASDDEMQIEKSVLAAYRCFECISAINKIRSLSIYKLPLRFCILSGAD
jgi:hypothetical protein